MDQLLFFELLKSGESDLVDFKEKHYFNSNNSNKENLSSFIKDIISFANTIRTTSAYIIIGVKQINAGSFVDLGIEESDLIDEAECLSKLDSWVKPFPKIIYSHKKFNNKFFTIIEIPVVYYPEILVATRSTTGLDSNRVYIRRGTRNVEADPQEIKQIHDWQAKLASEGDRFGGFKSRKSMAPTQQHKSESIMFNEETIYRLFGNEAAEDEDIERLKEYYFKNEVYNQIAVDLPIRILVAHKGIGKSALFKISHNEDLQNKRLSIIIRPDEVARFGRDGSNFHDLISNWKSGLTDILMIKSYKSLGLQLTESTNNCDIEEILSTIVSQTEAKLDEGNTSNISLARAFIQEKKINIYIDDLDRGWVGGREDIVRLSALLNAVRDICNLNSGLYFKISLRSDVYFLVRTSDESTDKIQSSVVWYSWTNHQILIMLIKRIETFFNRQIDENSLLIQEQRHIANLYLESVMDTRFQGSGKWSNVPIHRVLMSLIRQRPRDLVKLLTLAAREAYKEKSSKIKTKHFQNIFEEYSQDRVQDTINEFRSELPQIERLIFGMRPTRKTYKASDGYNFDTPTLILKIRDIISMGKFIFATGKEATPKELAQFLYKINFLTAKKQLEDEKIDRKYFEQNRYLSSDFTDFGYDWEIHMAYRWALQPKSFDDIFAEIGS